MAPALATATSFLSRVPWWVWAIAAAIVGVLLYGRRQRNKGEERALSGLERPADLPNAGSGIPTIGTDGEGNPVSWSPEPLAQQLYDAMKGKDWWVWGDQEYEKRSVLGSVAALTDDQLVAVWNAFNTLPKVTEEMANWGNLRNWMEDDSWYGDENYARIIAAFDRLGLHAKNI